MRQWRFIVRSGLGSVFQAWFADFNYQSRVWSRQALGVSAFCIVSTLLLCTPRWRIGANGCQECPRSARCCTQDESHENWTKLLALSTPRLPLCEPLLMMQPHFAGGTWFFCESNAWIYSMSMCQCQYAPQSPMKLNLRTHRETEWNR